MLLKQKDKPIAIKHNGVAFTKSSLNPYTLLIGTIKKKLNSINDIIQFKYNDIECGKFALSSTFRITRKGEINLKNKEERNIFFYMLAKSILNADGAINYIKKNNVHSGLFIDKGYVGEGELMQAITLAGKTVFNFMNYYKNNILIIKK